MLKIKINSNIEKVIKELENIKENLEKGYLVNYYESEKDIDLLELKEETLGLDFGIDYNDARGNAFRSCVANSDLLEDIQNSIAVINSIDIEDEITECESQNDIEDYIDNLIADIEKLIV